MRKTISLLLIGAAVMSVLLCSCDPNAQEEPSTEEESRIIAAIDKSTPVTAGNLITKTKTSGDDLVVEYYDSNSNLVESFVWTDDDSQKQHSVMTYTEDNLLSSRTELTPDGSNSIVTMYQYNSDSSVQSKTVSEYEQGVITKASTYDANDEMTGHSDYHYDDDKLTKIERFDGEDNLAEYFVYDYDDSDRAVKYSSYSPDEKLKKYSTFSFDENGKLAEEKYFNGNNELESYYKFSYYSNGVMKESTHYDANGKILSQDFFEDTTSAQ